MVEFFVPGHPATQGSKDQFGRESCKRLPEWRGRVAGFASEHVPAGWHQNGPMVVTVTFTIRRAKGHWKRNGDLTKGAPLLPIGRTGDVDKLARAILDGLTGIFFADDSQVVGLMVMKRYQQTMDDATGALIVVS